MQVALYPLSCLRSPDTNILKKALFCLMVSELRSVGYLASCFWACGEAEHHSKRTWQGEAEMRHTLQRQCPQWLTVSQESRQIMSRQWIHLLLNLEPSQASHLPEACQLATKQAFVQYISLRDTSYPSPSHNEAVDSCYPVLRTKGDLTL